MADPTPTPVNTPGDIEIAIEEFLVQRMTAFKAARRQKNMRYVFTDPALVVAIYEGKLEKVGLVSFRVNCQVHLQLRMSDARGEEARRDAIHPLVFAVIRMLARQRVGLKITDLLPGSFKDVTSEEDFKGNFIVYDLEFATSFILNIDDDDLAEDLLTVALNYYLKPGDDQVDASDTVSLGAQP